MKSDLIFFNTKEAEVLRRVEQIKRIMRNPEHCILGGSAEYKWWADNNGRAMRFRDYRISKFSLLGIIDHVCLPASNNQREKNYSEDIKESVNCCFRNELTIEERKNHGGFYGYYILKIDTHLKLLSWIEKVLRKQRVKTENVNAELG